jgi:histidinol dehydrogenase
VPEIVAVTPPDARGRIHPALLCALRLAGATEVYRVGGVQAIGLLAFGSATVRPVQKIFGPGNAYVVEAKRQVFGRVAIDLLPGPSEILVIADDSAEPAWIAADLLAQAEHGDGSRVALVTDSDALADAVLGEIERQSAKLTRREQLARVLKENAFIIRARNLEEAASIANTFAPEHLSIVSEKADWIASEVRTAGAIFLGPFSPVAAGDFLAGPSHELPTGGAGHSFPGLTADQFQRRTSLVEFDRASLRKSLPVLQEFARIEGLDAHGRSAEIRLEGGAKKKRAGASRPTKRAR